MTWGYPGLAHHSCVAGSHDIILNTGTTMGINMVAYAWAAPRLQAGDEIVLSVLEHHANIVPWHFLRERQGVVLKWVEPEADGGSIRQAPHPHFVEQVLGDRVIESQGDQGHGGAGKDDQGESVVDPAVEELPDDLFRHPETIGGLEIEGGHGSRDIQRHHQVDTLGALEPPRASQIG